MNKAAQFLKDCQTFYIATMDGNQPRVRPFGAVMEFEGKTCICTSNQKDCFKQMKANPNVEISGMLGDAWIRITGKVVSEPRREAKAAMLEACENIRDLYSVDDGIFEIMYFDDAQAAIYSYVAEPEIFKI